MSSELTVGTINSADRIRIPVYDAFPPGNPGVGSLALIQGDLYIYNGAQWSGLSGTRIKTNGLIAYIDFAKDISYPGTGTTINDLSGYSNDAVANGASFSSLNSGIFVFDGVDDSIDFNQTFIGNAADEIPEGDSSYTLEVWLKIVDDSNLTTSVTGGGANILGNDSSTGVGINLYRPSGNRINFGARSTSNFDNDSNLSVGQWYHVICTRNAGVFNYIYINGRLDSTNYSPTSLTIAANPANMRSGLSPNRIVQPFNGQIALYRIYNTYMSSVEVKNNYNNGAPRFNRPTIQ